MGARRQSLCAAPYRGCLGLILVGILEWTAALRTGVAPTYIPTMRQITSYETSNIDTYNDAVVTMQTLELEQGQGMQAVNIVDGHYQVENSWNTALKNETAALRSQLTTTKNNKVYSDDQSYREFDRNKGLEPQNVAITATKTTQDDYVWKTNQTNRQLDAHALATLSLNNALLAEKQALWVTIEKNEREEWFNRENSIAVEVQNPSEAKSREYHLEQQTLLNGFVDDLKVRNAQLYAQVPGLTVDRDTQEATKLAEIVTKNNLELKSDNLEVQVPTLMKSKAALEKLRMQFQQANSDLLAYNTKLKTEIETLKAERNALRTSYEDAENARNAAQIQADHWEVVFTDTKARKTEATLSRLVAHKAHDLPNAQAQVCLTKNTQLKTEEAALVSKNEQIRSHCY